MNNLLIVIGLQILANVFIKDLRESGELPFYKLRNTLLYKVQDVDRMMTRKKIT